MDNSSKITEKLWFYLRWRTISLHALDDRRSWPHMSETDNVGKVLDMGGSPAHAKAEPKEVLPSRRKASRVGSPSKQAA